MIKNSKKSTTNFLVYLAVFIIVVLLFVFLFIVPSIKEYKSSKLESTMLEKQSVKLLDEQKKLEKALLKTKEENENIEKLFTNKFNKFKFIKYAKNYFYDIKLTKVENKSKSSALDIYKLNANVKANNPRLLYDFINNLSKYESIVKINFPVKISSAEGVLDINFHLSIYSMKQK
jgi:hypothetical protein